MLRIYIYRPWLTSRSLCLPVLLWVRCGLDFCPLFLEIHIVVSPTIGMQNQFTPEQLGVISSSALAYIIFELIVYWITLYVFNISSAMLTLDLLAFSGYKFVAINLCILVSIIFKGFGYILILGYNSIAMFFFLVSC